MPNLLNANRQPSLRTNQNVSIQPMIEESLKIATPAWPLQNTVAVNPFWFLRHQTFEKGTLEASTAVQTSLMMPIGFYQEKIDQGEITGVSLEEAFKVSQKLWPDLPPHLKELVDRAKRAETLTCPLNTFAEYSDETGSRIAQVTAEIGKYAAAYLDDRQSTAPFPLVQEAFWSAWLKMQEFDLSMDIWGAEGFQAFSASLIGTDSAQAIALMINEMGLTPNSKALYLQRLSASVLGWSTQFKYLEWQSSLGYSVNRQTSTTDLLAVRMAYDYILFKLAKKGNSNQALKWLRELESSSERNASLAPTPIFQLQYTFQLAWEMSYQKQIVRKIEGTRNSKISIPRAQIVFCIDVRSEMIRRHIEAKDPNIQTIGFAGFFGLPFDFQRHDENQIGHRLPVLLKPSFELKETSQYNSELDREVLNVKNRLTSGYFRSLRKNSLSSFAHVELFGAIYITKMVHELWSGLFSQKNTKHIPSRFSPDKTTLNQAMLKKPCGDALETKEVVLRVAAVLRHMGLTTGFAEQVWIVGHGSVTKNNAFGSALDCGACGGHAGDLNARLLVSLLNDSSIREGLLGEQIEIPQSTLFIAGVHETVTDEIHPLLSSDQVTKASLKEIKEIHEIIRQASQETRNERQYARSSVLDSNTKRRSQNWSEIRPEWGLAGNACFIVAPRERTRGINLSSRSFLHDYDWYKDEKSGYQTLELIMTAPMVVTNWINLQYYASTVAPRVYGAGNKILHNLTNEVGVVEGNGGDLRVGLPIQSVHDGHQFVHDPLRLSVFIEAPREQIENIIQRHQTVRELVENEWLHLLHIDSSTLKVTRRSRSGDYI